MATMKHEEKAQDAKKAISGLKYQVGKAGKFIGQQAVQLHGGMGVTDELNVGHYFKRLTTVGTIFGNTDYHLKKYTSHHPNIRDHKGPMCNTHRSCIKRAV